MMQQFFKSVILTVACLALTACPSVTPQVGPQGPAGPAGAQGAPGIQGPPGPPASVPAPPPSPGAGIMPGQTGLIAAFPAGQFGFPTTMPAGLAPIWTTSDPINCPLIAAVNDTNSSQMLVSVPSGFTPTIGQTCILTVSNPDGSGASSIVIPFTAPAQEPFPYAIPSYQVAPSVITGYYVYQVQMTAVAAGAVDMKRL